MWLESAKVQFKPIIVYHPREDDPSRTVPEISPFDDDFKSVALFGEKEGFYRSLSDRLKSFKKSGGD